MNEEIKKYFKKAIENSTLFQAYLFCGPKETGKLEVAEFLKGKILKNQDDFISVVPLPNKKEISIEQIRDLIKKVSYREEVGRKKIILIVNAQRMNLAAANGLLKILEEPDERLIFVLLTDREESIIATIRSRCHKIFFHLKNLEEIKKYLINKFSDKSEKIITETAELSKGRYVLAEKLIQDSIFRLENKKIFDDFRQAIKGNWNEGLELAEFLAGKKSDKTREEIVERIEHWTWSLMDYLKLDLEKNDNLSAQKKIYQIIRGLLELKKRIEQSNADEKLQLENFFVQMM